MKSNARVESGKYFEIIELEDADIYLENYSDETLTIRECLENDWWYTEPNHATRLRSQYIYNTLNIDNLGIKKKIS